MTAAEGAANGAGDDAGDDAGGELDASVRNLVLTAFLDDQAAGVVRTLVEYQALHPGTRPASPTNSAPCWTLSNRHPCSRSAATRCVANSAAAARPRCISPTIRACSATSR